MNSSDIALLMANELFREMPQADLDLILAHGTTCNVAKGELIMEEGETGKELLVILEGEVDIFRKDPATLTEHHITTLHSGDTIGEMALIDKSPRSASVRAKMETRLLVLPLNVIDSLSDSSALNIALRLGGRLRKTSEVAIKSLQAELDGTKLRLEMSSLFFKIFIVLSFWIFFDRFIQQFGSTLGQERTLLSVFLITCIFMLILVHVRKSIFPLSFFGLILTNWRKNCLAAASWSLLFIVITLVLKRFLAVFVVRDPAIPYVDIRFSLFTVLYILFVPLQEFMVRGVFQSSLQVFLNKRNPVFAIFLSNLMFAALHVQIGTIFAFFAFAGGVFWGWMYFRQHSLVGPIVSHIIIGSWLGVETGVRQIFLEFALPQ